MNSSAATVAVMDGSAQAACISCMFDSLANWWSNLDWWEKGLVIIGGVAIGWAISGGFLAGLGGAMVFVSVADGGKAIGAFIRDPIGETNKWWDNFVSLSEREKAEVLGTAVISKALERVGIGFLKKSFGGGKGKGGSGDQLSSGRGGQTDSGGSQRHYRYYGVTHNYRSIAMFKQEIQKILFKWAKSEKSEEKLYDGAIY